jgi:hypothetical protein
MDLTDLLWATGVWLALLAAPVLLLLHLVQG